MSSVCVYFSGTVMAKWPCAVQVAPARPRAHLDKEPSEHLSCLFGSAFSPGCRGRIYCALIGGNADLKPRFSPLRPWLLLFLRRRVRGDAAGRDAVSIFASVMRFRARVRAQRRVVRRRVAARPLQFCWWPLPPSWC